MKIGIEAQRIFRAKKHGMDIVALELIKHLQRIDTINEYFIFVKKGPDKCIQETANCKIIDVPGLTYADWEQIMLPFFVKKTGIDILHCTSNTAPLFVSAPVILTLHDIIFLEKGGTDINKSLYQWLGKLYRKLVVPKVLSTCKRILTVSHYEANVIGTKLPDTESKLRVLYNGVGQHFFTKPSKERLEEVKSRYSLPDDFIFYLGNTDPKKNLENTLIGYATYASASYHPLPLVVADIDPGWVLEVMKKRGFESLVSLVQIKGYIKNSDMPCLYRSCRLFLYPSKRESFGIPILEAMASEVPVITSNITAMPEVAGNAAILVDPENTNEIAKAIKQVIESEGIADEYIRKGMERCSTFGWNDSASKLQSHYTELVTSKQIRA